MSDTKTLDAQLNQQILGGDILNAFDKFYASDIVMQENVDAPKVGKEACRKAEVEFLDAVKEFHGAKLLSSAVEGDVSFSEWEYDITFKEWGHKVMNQVAVRRWKNGQVVHERFYYKG